MTTKNQWSPSHEVKQATESLPSLNLQLLNTNDQLYPGSTGYIQSNDLTMAYTVSEDTILIEYNDNSQVIRLNTMPVYFGGKRRWLVCPCGKQARILYCKDKVFKCRQCHRLNYATQHERHTTRMLRQSISMSRAPRKKSRLSKRHHAQASILRSIALIELSSKCGVKVYFKK